MDLLKYSLSLRLLDLDSDLLLGHDPIAERAQLLDDHLGRIPGPQGNHGCGNPGSDNITGHQRHPLTQVRDDLGDLEDQVPGPSTARELIEVIQIMSVPEPISKFRSAPGSPKVDMTP